MSRGLRIDYVESALQQLDEMADYIADQGQPDAGRRLLLRFADVVDTLIRFPLTGHRYETDHPRLQDIRVIGVPGYSVVVYHRVLDDRIVINAVLHGSRGRAFVEGAIAGGE